MRICNLVPVWIKCTYSKAPIPLTGVGDTVGVPCLGGGLQVGVTLNWDTKNSVFLIRYIHKICLTKVIFIVEKHSKSKITKSPFRLRIEFFTLPWHFLYKITPELSLLSPSPLPSSLSPLPTPWKNTCVQIDSQCEALAKRTGKSAQVDAS